MICPERKYATEQDADKWIAEHLLPSNHPLFKTPEYDQKRAAVSELTNWFSHVGMHGVSRGLLGSFASVPTTKEIKRSRTVVKAYLAAESVGIRAYCDHVNGSPRPLAVMCDPPLVCCVSCLPKVLPEAKKIGFLYENLCDVCGKESKMMVNFGMSLANMMVSGNMCPSCSEQENKYIANLTSPIAVGPNKPCACGSGVKYKKCHGRPQST